jgi:hypothetical protein
MTEKRVRTLKFVPRVEISKNESEPKGAWFSRLIAREEKLSAVLKGEF